MRQVVVIHGGDSFASYEAYWSFLSNFKFESLDYLKRTPDWKADLQTVLGAGYEVLLPQMPNKQNARYSEWKIWFEKIVPFLNEEVVLIGHSLGGVFLAKYLSGNGFIKRIVATMLVAAPFSEGEFSLQSLKKFEAQSEKIFLYHSENDPVVPFSEMEKYRAQLPAAIARIFPDRKHFNQPDLPELVADIKAL